MARKPRKQVTSGGVKYHSGSNYPSYVPTEDDIVKMCLKIQSCWSANEMNRAIHGLYDRYVNEEIIWCRCGTLAVRPYATYAVCEDCYKEIFVKDKHVCPGNGRSSLGSEDGADHFDHPVWWEQISNEY